VNPGTELFAGANQEKFGYPPLPAARSSFTYISDYPQVILALTHQLHTAIREDQLSILNSNQNIVQTYLDGSHCACCLCGTPNLAFQILTTSENNYQGLYFDSGIPMSGLLAKIKNAVSVTLFYDLFNNHYGPIDDFLTGFADDCIPNILSLQFHPSDSSGGICGCCVAPDPSTGYIYPCF